MDVPANNPPECSNLYKEAMDLIKGMNIYDLYRTYYPGGGLTANLNRL